MTLVLLHAFPLDSRIWELQKAALDGEFTVLAPDLRGFGSAAPGLGDRDELSIDQAADDVIELLDQRGIRRAAIAGISRGGYIALSLARRYPERLSALILMDTRATPADEKEKANSAQLIGKLRNEGIGALPSLMRPRLFRPATSEALVSQIAEIIVSQQPAAVIAASRGMAQRPDARTALAQISMPVLALAGVQDAAFEDTRAIAKAIPGAEFLEIPEAGHLSNLEQPELVNQAMLRFLRLHFPSRP